MEKLSVPTSRIMNVQPAVAVGARGGKHQTRSPGSSLVRAQTGIRGGEEW